MFSRVLKCQEERREDAKQGPKYVYYVHSTVLLRLTFPPQIHKLNSLPMQEIKPLPPVAV